MVDWAWPGPRAFVEGVADGARRAGAMAVVAPPHCPQGLPDAVESALGTTHDRARRLSAGERTPLGSLSQAVGVEIRSAHGLRRLREADGVAVIVEGLDADAFDRWDAPLRAFVDGARDATRYGLVIVLVASPEAEPLLRAARVAVAPWRGVVGRTDATRAALDALGPSRGVVLDRLTVETAVGVGGWDLDRVAEEAARRSASLDALLTTPAPATGEVAASWTAGWEDKFDGRPFVHPDVANAQELGRRTWAAQVSVLFGWLEELRVAFVSAHPHLLRELKTPSSDCEWGPLSVHLRNIDPRRTAPFAEACRRLRNRLAHREPATASDLAPVLEGARRLGL